MYFCGPRTFRGRRLSSGRGRAPDAVPCLRQLHAHGLPWRVAPRVRAAMRKWQYGFPVWTAHSMLASRLAFTLPSVSSHMDFPYGLPLGNMHTRICHVTKCSPVWASRWTYAFPVWTAHWTFSFPAWAPHWTYAYPNATGTPLGAAGRTAWGTGPSATLSRLTRAPAL